MSWTLKSLPIRAKIALVIVLSCSLALLASFLLQVYFDFQSAKEHRVARAHAKETDQNPDDSCARLILGCSVEQSWGDHHISVDRCRETQ